MIDYSCTSMFSRHLCFKNEVKGERLLFLLLFSSCQRLRENYVSVYVSVIAFL